MNRTTGRCDYISTRAAAPELTFEDTMLTELHAMGGLPPSRPSFP